MRSPKVIEKWAVANLGGFFMTRVGLGQKKSIYSFFMDPLWGEMSITHVAKRELELV